MSREFSKLEHYSMSAAVLGLYAMDFGGEYFWTRCGFETWKNYTDKGDAPHTRNC